MMRLVTTLMTRSLQRTLITSSAEDAGEELCKDSYVGSSAEDADNKSSAEDNTPGAVMRIQILLIEDGDAR